MGLGVGFYSAAHAEFDKAFVAFLVAAGQRVPQPSGRTPHTNISDNIPLRHYRKTGSCGIAEAMPEEHESPTIGTFDCSQNVCGSLRIQDFGTSAMFSFLVNHAKQGGGAWRWLYWSDPVGRLVRPPP